MDIQAAAPVKKSCACKVGVRLSIFGMEVNQVADVKRSTLRCPCCGARYPDRHNHRNCDRNMVHGISGCDRYDMWLSEVNIIDDDDE
jgi:hypothetical protein